jgi:hypothetical protein
MKGESRPASFVVFEPFTYKYDGRNMKEEGILENKQQNANKNDDNDNEEGASFLIKMMCGRRHTNFRSILRTNQ